MSKVFTFFHKFVRDTFRTINSFDSRVRKTPSPFPLPTSLSTLVVRKQEATRVKSSDGVIDAYKGQSDFTSWANYTDFDLVKETCKRLLRCVYVLQSPQAPDQRKVWQTIQLNPSIR